MKRLIAAFFVTTLIATSSAMAANTPPSLDGKTYEGTIGKSGKKADPDNFIFKDGKFRSTACDQYGFTEGAYTAKTEKGLTKFHATTKNDKGAQITWNGQIKGDHIQGKALMTAPKEKPDNMTFSGNAKS